MTVRTFATTLRAFAASVGATSASLLRRLGVRLAEKFRGRVLHARAAASVFERVAAQAVAERDRRDAAHVFEGSLSALLDGCERARGSRNRDLTAVCVDAES